MTGWVRFALASAAGYFAARVVAEALGLDHLVEWLANLYRSVAPAALYAGPDQTASVVID